MTQAEQSQSNSKTAIQDMMKRIKENRVEDKELEDEYKKAAVILRRERHAIAKQLFQLHWNIYEGQTLIRITNERTIYGCKSVATLGRVMKVVSYRNYHFTESHHPSVMAVVKKKDGKWGTREYFIMAHDFQVIGEE